MKNDQIKNILNQAIDDYLTTEIKYKDDVQYRKIHPYLYGINGGRMQLMAYQISGPSESGKKIDWKNFIFSDIKDIKLMAEKFIPKDSGYNPNSDGKYTDVENRIRCKNGPKP